MIFGAAVVLLAAIIWFWPTKMLKMSEPARESAQESVIRQSLRRQELENRKWRMVTICRDCCIVVSKDCICCPTCATFGPKWQDELPSRQVDGRRQYMAHGEEVWEDEL